MSFKVVRVSWSGEEMWVLHGPDGRRAGVVPQLGANLIELALSPGVGRSAVSLIPTPPDAKTLRERPTRYGSPVLFPFPSRIAGGKFTFQGRTYQLDVLPDGNARHGFVMNRAFRVESYGADDGRAWLTVSLDGNIDEIQRQFPFPFHLAMTFRLDVQGLTAHVVGTNTGSRPMPMGFGWHPYFRTPLSPNGNVADCRLQVRCSHYWELAPDLVPTGRTLPVSGKLDLRDAPPIADHAYDNILTAPERDGQGWSHASLIDDAVGLSVTVSVGPSFREWVIYTPPDRSVVCLEPYTCTGNAFNLQTAGVDAGVIDLAPGASWKDDLRIAVAPVR